MAAPVRGRAGVKTMDWLVWVSGGSAVSAFAMMAVSGLLKGRKD
jgi:hypothetical protein